jgi:GDP-L-fucose synthase
VDDLADASLFLMQRYSDESHINVGTGEDLSIAELARLVADIVYPGATLAFDESKPDGMLRKRLDVSRIHALGWRHTIGLREGIESTYAWFLAHGAEARGVVGSAGARS